MPLQQEAVENTRFFGRDLVSKETEKGLFSPRVLHWAGKGFWAVTDQALFAGTNFLVNILLARRLSPEEYGAFALAYSVFLFLAGLHSAVLTEPMMVFGAGKYADCFLPYFKILLHGHWAVAGLIALLLALAAWVLGHTALAIPAQAFAGLTLAAPFILYSWLLRRAFYVKGAPQWSALGGGLYLVLMLGTFGGLHALGKLSPFCAFLALGTVSGLVSILLLRFLAGGSKKEETTPERNSVLGAHWAYGRWLALHSLVFWVSSQASVPALTAFQGLAMAGVYRAYQNLTLPIFHFLMALGSLVLPAASRRYRQEGFIGLKKITVSWTMLALLCAIFYSTIIYALRRPLVAFLLGEPYMAYTDLLGIWLLGPVIVVLGRGGEIMARVAERPQFVLYSYLVGSVATVGLFLFLVPAFGLWGAAWATVGSFAVQTLIITILSWSICKGAVFRVRH